MTNGYQYYRCSTMQSEYTIRSKPNPKVVNTVMNSLRMDASEQKARLELVSRHRSLLRQKDMEEQVNQIVERLVIPNVWYELILAYYLDDKGMSEFELRSYNLRQELTASESCSNAVTSHRPSMNRLISSLTGRYSACSHWPDPQFFGTL